MDREATEGTAQELSAVELKKRMDTLDGLGGNVIRFFIVVTLAADARAHPQGISSRVHVAAFEQAQTSSRPRRARRIEGTVGDGLVPGMKGFP